MEITKVLELGGQTWAVSVSVDGLTFFVGSAVLFLILLAATVMAVRLVNWRIKAIEGTIEQRIHTAMSSASPPGVSEERIRKIIRELGASPRARPLNAGMPADQVQRLIDTELENFGERQKQEMSRIALELDDQMLSGEADRIKAVLRQLGILGRPTKPRERPQGEPVDPGSVTGSFTPEELLEKAGKGGGR